MYHDHFLSPTGRKWIMLRTLLWIMVVTGTLYVFLLGFLFANLLVLAGLVAMFGMGYLAGVKATWWVAVPGQGQEVRQ